MVGVGERATATGDFDSGGTTPGTLLRLAITCIFFRRAAWRERILWTTEDDVSRESVMLYEVVSKKHLHFRIACLSSASTPFTASSSALDPLES